MSLMLTFIFEHFHLNFDPMWYDQHHTCFVRIQLIFQFCEESIKNQIFATRRFNFKIYYVNLVCLYFKFSKR